MGDAFRGLTIKIGADTRSVQKAISSIKSSARGAQSQLNALNKALKFDGTNIQALNARLELADDKALHAARSALILKSAMSAASSETIQLGIGGERVSMSLKDAADKMQHVYAEAEKTKSAYNGIDKEIAHIDEAMAKVIAKEDKLSFNKALRSLRTLKEDAAKLGPEFDEARAKIARLLSMVSQGGAGKGFKDLEISVEALTRRYDSLRSQHVAYQRQLEALGRVEGFRNARVQLMAYEAELKEAAATAVRFRSELYATGSSEGLAKALAYTQRLDSAMEKSVTEARQMSAAYDAMPRSLEAARAKIVSMKNAEEALTEKARSLEAVLKEVSANTKFDRVAASTKNVYMAFEKASHEAEKFEAAVLEAAARVDRLDHELLDAKTSANGLSAAGRSVKTIEAAIEKANSELAEMKAKALAADEALEKAAVNKRWRETDAELKRVIADMERLRAESSKLRAAMNFGTGLRELGYGLYSTLTPAIMITGRYAIQAAQDIDSAYRDMRKTVNGTEEEFEHLKDAALEFSQTHVTSAETILEIEAMGGQLGIQARNLESFAQVISNLEIATDIGAEDMAKYVGQLSNIMRDINQDNPEEYTRNITAFSDALVRLGNNSAAQESSIMKVMMRIASLGNISGMTTPQLLAISTAVAATGQGCEAAGTAISKTFSNIEQAVGAGGDQLQAFAQVSGMSAQEFADAWNGDPITAFTSFIGGLKKIDEAGGSVDNTLTGLKITSVRQKQALEGLVNTYDVLTESLGMSQDAWDGLATKMRDGTMEEAGDAAREAQRKSEGFSGELEMMKNNAKVLASELASGAVPIIKSLGDMFEDFASKVKAMPDGFKTAIVGVAGFLALIGPVGVAVGTTTRAIASMISFFGKMQGAIELAGVAAQVKALDVSSKTASKSLNGLGKALQFLSTTGGMVGVGLATAAIAYLATSIADSAAKHQKHIDNVKGLNEVLLQTNPAALSAAGGLKSLAEGAKTTSYAFDDVVEANSKMITSIKERNKSAEAEIGTLQAARIAIEKYGNANRQLTGAQQGELKAAIDLVNEKCGTQFQILDLLTGKLGDEKGAYLDNIGAINEYIANKQKLIEVEALEGDLAELQAQKRQTLAALIATNDESESQRLWTELKGIDSAIESTTKMLGDAAAAADGAKMSLGQLVEQSTDFQAYFEGLFSYLAGQGVQTPWASYQESLVAFGDALNKTGLDISAFTDLSYEQMATLTTTWMKSGGDINATLASIGLAAVSAADQFKSAFEGVGADFNGVVEGLSTTADELAQKLQNAGMSASDFANFTSEEIGTALAESGGNVDEFVAKLQEIGQQKVEVEAEASVDSSGAEEGFAAAEEAGDEFADGDYEAEAEVDNDDAIDGFDDAENAGEDYARTYTASAALDTSSAYSSLRSLQSELDNFARTTYTAGVSSERRASGGVSARIISALPRNASGGINGIVTRATMTNVGLVGEAGDEALFHMRHAGGAIIPLSNRRHVRPFARAVASEMPGGQTVNNYTINLDYSAGEDANQLVRDIGMALRTTALLEG